MTFKDLGGYANGELVVFSGGVGVGRSMMSRGLDVDQLGKLTKRETWDSLSSVVSVMVKEFKLPEDKIDFNGLRIIYGSTKIGLSSGVLSVGSVTLNKSKKDKND